MEASPPEPKVPTTGEILAVGSQLYLRPLASILLIGSPWVGAGLWIVLLQEPRQAVVAFIALTIIEVIGRVMERTDVTVFNELTRANALLCSLAAAFLLAPMGLSMLLEVVFVSVALCLGLYFTLVIQRLLRKTTLPTVIWPYCVFAAIMAVLLPSGVYNSMIHFNWQFVEVATVVDLPNAFLRTMGGFLFSPSLGSGIVIAFLVFVWSPAMFLSGIAGWLTGAFVSMALVTVGVDAGWPMTSYNFFLSGMALGAVFFLPGASGMAIAAFAGVVAALFAAALRVYLGSSGIAYLPIPFGLTLFTGLLALDHAAFTPGLRRNLVWFERPEDSWIKDAWSRKRWGELGELLAVPFVGPVELVQGFDGTLTHRGAWKHAMDFQRPSFSNHADGRPSMLGEPVYSPVIGEVADIRNDVSDNPPGIANYGDNWGNYVMLRTVRGNYVLLAHFMFGSVAVAPGQRVSYPTYLGSVGNSGRSTVPHLHVQVQADSAVGAPTKPFALANYLTFSGEGGMTRTWHATGKLEEGEVIEAAHPNPAVIRQLTTTGPGRAIWTVAIQGDVPASAQSTGPVITEGTISESGTYVMTTNEGAEVEYRFDADAVRVIRIVGAPGTTTATAMIAASSIPYCALPGMRWTDLLPLTDVRPLQFARKILSPFEVQVFVTVICECLEVPDGAFGTLVVRARPTKRYPGLPIAATLTMTPLRGPSRIEAEYPHGSVTYEVTSFAPRST